MLSAGGGVVVGVRCRVRCQTCGRDRESKEFGVKVGVQQGSILSPLLFTTVLEALSGAAILNIFFYCTPKKKIIRSWRKQGSYHHHTTFCISAVKQKQLMTKAMKVEDTQKLGKSTEASMMTADVWHLSKKKHLSNRGSEGKTGY